MRRGIAVSPGVAIGVACCIDEVHARREPVPLDEGQVAEELARFDAACAAAAEELAGLYHKLTAQVGREAADIFRYHEHILHDANFLSKVKGWIVENRVSAPTALHHVMNEYASAYARIKDDYYRERFADVRDVITRVNRHLITDFPQTHAESPANEPVVVVAHELLPSQVTAFGHRRIAAIVTEMGGTTSHAAIIARSQGIPAVSGVRGVLEEVQDGDVIVVDGREGHVLINPGPEALSAYRKLQREFVHLKDRLAENWDQAAESADGTPVELLANINNRDDAEAARRMGATGVGLFRTEYLFLTHPDVPDEDEQYRFYRQIIEASPNRRVTIRTLDLGGDKTVPYLSRQTEANPFMGWRSIRLSFEHPHFFQTQIRAILRAAVHGDVRLMFPMITTVDEVRKLQRMVRVCKRDLSMRNVPFAETLPCGIMVEVPAAAVSIDTLLEHVDFVSIGTNDLVQYLMAADRDNPKVAPLCQPLSPPVLRLLDSVVKACLAAGVPVSVCGEMAGRPRAFMLLLAMGLRSFSMSPAMIPTIKELLSHLTLAQAKVFLEHVMHMKTSGHIKAYLSRQLANVCPSLTMLDSA